MSFNCFNFTLPTDIPSHINSLLFVLIAAQSAISAVSIVVNGWILFVSWGDARVGVGFFKYPLCYLALCDMWFAAVKLLNVHLVQVAPGWLYQSVCNLIANFTIGASNTMICALVATPLQRYLVFDDNAISEHAKRPRSIIIFCAVLFLIPTFPTLAAVVAPADSCLISDTCFNPAVNTLFFRAVRIPPLIAYPVAIVLVALLIHKFRQMNNIVGDIECEQVTPDNNDNHNRQFLAAVLIQTVNPVLLGLPVIVFIVLFDGFDDAKHRVARELSTGLFVLNTLLDAMSTIYFIKVYRTLAKGLWSYIKGCFIGEEESLFQKVRHPPHN